jgi:membrane protein implicated in regulation of membrane protease activity
MSQQLIRERAAQLEARIRELGSEVDDYRAKTAAALGGGVFLLLLAAGAAYDLIAGNAFVWLALGISSNALAGIAVLLGVGGAFLLRTAAARERNRDRQLEARLASLEEELMNLLERKQAEQH